MGGVSVVDNQVAARLAANHPQNIHAPYMRNPDRCNRLRASSRGALRVSAQRRARLITYYQEEK
jgi:hypothetical protein